MAKIIINLTKEQLEALSRDGSLSIEVSGDMMTVQGASALPVDNGGSFFEVFKDQIRKFKAGGCLRTVETYQAAFRKFSRFMGDEDISPGRITSDLVEAFQGYLREQDLGLNTVSFHMRIVRAVYHKAVERGMCSDVRPFRHVYTGQARTAKRALTVKEIRRIRNVSLDDPRLAFARDMFLFSFYMRGMAFVDMAYLKKKDLRNGVLTYKRHKTGQPLTIQWEKPMQEIVDRYPSKTGKYLLPLIHTLNGKERNQYRNFQSKINEDLKVVAGKARISKKLTMYCARHSWATIARLIKMPLGVISSGMGHSNEKTTEIYLDSIDVRMIDRANRHIIRMLSEEPQEPGEDDDLLPVL